MRFFIPETIFGHEKHFAGVITSKDMSMYTVSGQPSLIFLSLIFSGCYRFRNHIGILLSMYLKPILSAETYHMH